MWNFPQYSRKILSKFESFVKFILYQGLKPIIWAFKSCYWFGRNGRTFSEVCIYINSQKNVFLNIFQFLWNFSQYSRKILTKFGSFVNLILYQDLKPIVWAFKSCYWFGRNGRTFSEVCIYINSQKNVFLNIFQFLWNFSQYSRKILTKFGSFVNLILYQDLKPIVWAFKSCYWFGRNGRTFSEVCIYINSQKSNFFNIFHNLWNFPQYSRKILSKFESFVKFILYQGLKPIIWAFKSCYWFGRNGRTFSEVCIYINSQKNVFLNIFQFLWNFSQYSGKILTKFGSFVKFIFYQS